MIVTHKHIYWGRTSCNILEYMMKLLLYSYSEFVYLYSPHKCNSLLQFSQFGNEVYQIFSYLLHLSVDNHIDSSIHSITFRESLIFKQNTCTFYNAIKAVYLYTVEESYKPQRKSLID